MSSSFSVVGIVMEYAPLGTLFNVMIKNQWLNGMPLKYVQQVAVQVYAYMLSIFLSLVLLHTVIHTMLCIET